MQNLSDRDEFPATSSDTPMRERFSPECRRLLRQAGLGVWELDVETRMYRGDETTLKLLGIRSEEKVFRAEDVYARLTPEAPDLIGRKIIEAMKEGHREQSFELGIIGDDGEARWIRVCVQNEFDESGRLIFRYGTIRDVTDEPKVQPWNPSRETRLTRAIRGAKVIPWEYDVEADTLLIDPINAEDAEFPSGRPIALARLLDRIHPEDRESVAAAVDRQRRNPRRELCGQ